MGVKRLVLDALPPRVADGVRQVARRTRLEAERRGALQRHLNRSITVTGLPRRRRRPGSVWAVSMVKNEADIVPASIRHMLGQGVDGIIVVDNGSTDGTRAVLDALTVQFDRLHVGTDSEPAFHQGMKTSYLAHLAWRAGADWVVPFDADEFWYADGVTVAELLRVLDSDHARGDFRNVYPLADRGKLDPDDTGDVQVDRRATGWLKIAFRARRWTWVGEGNHDLRTSGERTLVCLHLLHFPYRSLAQYSRKAEQGVAALEKAGKDESIATHWRGWVSLSEAGRNERWLAYLRGDVEASGAFSTTDRLTVPDPTRWRTWDPDGFFAGVRLPDQA